jgi:hypothetical protein
MKFELTEDQQQKLAVWLREQYNKIAKQQLAAFPAHFKNFFKQDAEGNWIPYFDSDGCVLTYSFSPTRLGNVVIVTIAKGTFWEAEINLTNYDNW